MADLKFRAFVVIELVSGRNVKIPNDSNIYEQIITVPEDDIEDFETAGGFDLSDLAALDLAYTTTIEEAWTNADEATILLEKPDTNLWTGSYSEVLESIKQTSVVSKKLFIERLDWHTSDEVA